MVNRRLQNMKRNKSKRRLGLQRPKKRLEGCLRQIEKLKHEEETQQMIQIEPGVYISQ